MLSSKEASLLAALEPRAEAEGIEIVTVEVVGVPQGANHPRVSGYAGGNRVRGHHGCPCG